jgi:hypothetical protein
MSKHLLLISENNKINPIFVKANSNLIKKFKNKFRSTNIIRDKTMLLETLWQSEYQVSIQKIGSATTLTTEQWQAIEFQSNNDLMMFILRWS